MNPIRIINQGEVREWAPRRMDLPPIEDETGSGKAWMQPSPRPRIPRTRRTLHDIGSPGLLVALVIVSAICAAGFIWWAVASIAGGRP